MEELAAGSPRGSPPPLSAVLRARPEIRPLGGRMGVESSELDGRILQKLGGRVALFPAGGSQGRAVCRSRIHSNHSLLKRQLREV